MKYIHDLNVQSEIEKTNASNEDSERVINELRPSPFDLLAVIPIRIPAAGVAGSQ